VSALYCTCWQWHFHAGLVLPLLITLAVTGTQFLLHLHPENQLTQHFEKKNAIEHRERGIAGLRKESARKITQAGKQRQSENIKQFHSRSPQRPARKLIPR
jgi:uncharacterized iron-regulated membrane protein